LWRRVHRRRLGRRRPRLARSPVGGGLIGAAQDEVPGAPGPVQGHRAATAIRRSASRGGRLPWFEGRAGQVVLARLAPVRGSCFLAVGHGSPGGGPIRAAAADTGHGPVRDACWQLATGRPWWPGVSRVWPVRAAAGSLVFRCRTCLACRRRGTATHRADSAICRTARWMVRIGSASLVPCAGVNGRHAHSCSAPTPSTTNRPCCETWHPATRPASIGFDPAVCYLSLDVLDSTSGGPFGGEGIVEFRARYTAGSVPGELHDRSCLVRDHKRADLRRRHVSRRENSPPSSARPGCRDLARYRCRRGPQAR
jgi:hypothetical protein